MPPYPIIIKNMIMSVMMSHALHKERSAWHRSLTLIFQVTIFQLKWY